MPTEAPTWEETTELEPLWEETTPFEEPVALERPDIVVEPQTGVVQSAAPGSIVPTALKPSVRLIGGEQVTGQIGDTHPDIIKRESIPAVDIDQRGFQGPGGEFFPRESAAIATGLPTEMEPTRLHSTDLAKAESEAKPPTFQAPLEITPWKPLYTPEEVKAYHEAEKYGGIFPEGLTPEQKLRRTEAGERFFGPTPEELEAMGGAAGSRQGVVPVISAVMPILPVGIGGTSGKALMGYFTADFIARQPEIYAQAKEAYDRGDMDTVRRIVTEDVLAGGMMAVGAKETFAPSGGRMTTITRPEITRVPETPVPKTPVPKTEVSPTTGFKTTPLAETEIWNWLGKEHGVKKGGFVEVVPEFEPGKEGTIAELRWRRTTDAAGNEVLEPTGIRVNQSAVYNKNVLKEFVDHELGHYVDLKKPEVIGQVLDQMPLEERLSIDKQIEKLKYPTKEKAYEFNARAIHQMAKAWRGRPWFERIVLNVKSFLGETIGLKASDKVLRARAEKVAVRALSWASRRIREAATPKESAPSISRPTSDVVRKSYGEKYIQELGIEGAQRRLDDLTFKLNNGKRLDGTRMSVREMENLADEADNLRRAISKSTSSSFAARAEKLEPEKPGMVRLYSGSEGAGIKSSWFTERPERASSFGPYISYIDVPKSVAESARQQIKTDYVLPDKWANKAITIPEPVPQRTFDVGTFAGKSEREFPKESVLAQGRALSAWKDNKTGRIFTGEWGETHSDVARKVGRDFLTSDRIRNGEIEQGFTIPSGDFITVNEFDNGSKGWFQSYSGFGRFAPDEIKFSLSERRPGEFGALSGKLQEGGDPGITTKELVKMTPDELVAWKKRVLYGPRTYQILRESMKPEDAEALRSERDRLRSETKSILDKVEGGTLQERLDAATKAGPIYTKSATLNEVLEAQPKEVGAFAAKAEKEVPKEVTDAQIAWKKAEKRWRRAMRQEPSDRWDSELDRIEAEGIFRDLAEKNNISEEQYYRLRADAKALETDVMASAEESGTFAAKAPPPTAPIGEAAEQLTERLKTTPAVGTRERLSLRETIADAWSQGKAIFDRSRARGQAITETIKDAAKGAREPSELDKRVGELDWLLQRAAGQSRDMGKTMRKQVRDANLRRAAAIWIDTPGDAATKTSTIRIALSDLQLNPELWRKTPNEVKRAIETAANMPAEGIQFAESLREYYARRNQDAVDHSLFEHGLEDYFTHVWGNEKNMPDDLRGAIGGGRVQTYWQFSRQRKLGTFLDGIMRGKIPQLDPANVLPFYNYTLDRAIASRSFIKNITDNMVASDGRAVVAPTGTLSRVPQGQPTEASLVRPKGKTGEIADYKTINHPALLKWKWMANDENGKPILSQNDLVVHPEHYERLARMMDMSRLKGSRVSEALLRASTEVKGFKLGLLSAFHQVHVGSHALFHWTLPFNFKDPRFFTPDGDIRWNSPDVRFAIEKGHLKIAPDARELKIFAEGLLSPGLIHKIPIVGPWSRAYSEWTFGEYIPKLKLKTFAAAMPRNLRWYRGKLSEDAIAARVGDAVNNAYGELNNLFLGKIGRNPATQRMLRGIFLAPDFGEARLRFVGKGLTSYGTEERLALATMFITLYTAARVGNWLSHGDPELDPKRAFQVKSGKHWWSMRSVIGDLDRAFLDTSRFFYVRLNPLYSRTAADWLFGRDINGRKLSPMEKIVKRPLNQLVPIQFQALTRDDQALWESLIGAMGLGAVSDTPQQDVYRLVDNWMKKSDDPKLQAAFKRREAEVFPPSDYTKLRYALRHDDEKGAKKAYAELLKTRKPATITDAMLPGKPFTGSYPNELKFRNSLTDAQQRVYDQARQEQKEMYSKFQIIRRSPEPVEKEPTWEETVPVTE